MKICSTCHQEKAESEYYLKRKGELALQNNCIICTKLLATRHRKSLKGQEYAMKYRLSRQKIVRGEYNKSTKGKAKIREYFRSEQGKSKIRKYQQSQKCKLARAKRDSIRRKLAGERLSDSIRVELWASLKGNKSGRKWEKLLGYSLDTLKKHLESLFQPGMNWDNYGKNGWHLDHIIPKSVFCFNTEKDADFIRCWSLNNLQPLWGKDNIIKDNQIIKPFQPSLDLQLKNKQFITNKV